MPFWFTLFKKEKSVAFFATDFIDICLRFALIDVMYEEEKPFIVLDDPFVNLDEAKIKKAVMLLKEISNSYQIIYFTCHESRM